MVELAAFKNKIQELLHQKYKIEFYEDEEIVKRITEEKANKIYNWITKIIDPNTAPDGISRKKYKVWQAGQILVFIYRFKIDNECRILALKVKNSNFIEFHLGLHDYYDEIRRALGLAT